jgi:sporulation protein YlmC with PRC-barrel domain
MPEEAWTRTGVEQFSDRRAFNILKFAAMHSRTDERGGDRMPELTLDSMKEKRIYTTEGLSVGTVQRFELDTVLWKVRSIVVEVDDVAMEPLGLKKSLMRKNEIMIGKELVKSVGDVINLNVSLEILKKQLSLPTSKKKVVSTD